MAIPTELGVSFTQTEIDDMKAAANAIIAIVRSKKILNMTNDEKSFKLSTVGDERLPFVLKSIGDYAVAYPHLNGLGYPYAMAADDRATLGQLFEVQTTMAEANEVVDEMRLLAGHFCYKFMRAQYKNAQSYLGDNVEGAQVVYDGLKDCFEGQGSQGEADDATSGSDPAPAPDAE